MNNPLLPFGINDLDPNIVVNQGPPKRSRCFVRGCTEFLEPARWANGPTCPKHGIRCNTSGTFSYGNPTRNIIVDQTIFERSIIGHPDKYESDRMGSEKSEDALTWNVFRSFQNAGCLGRMAAEVFGLPSQIEPRLYLWGLSLTDDSFVFWDRIRVARKQFESNLPVERPLTEPDIVLHLPGVYLALIEAKFTSENGVYLRGPRKDDKSLTMEELLSIYSFPSIQLLDVPTAAGCSRVHYQLWRNTVFADWIAQQELPATKAYHFNLVRHGFEEESEIEFRGLVADGFKDRFRRVTWESIYATAVNDRTRFENLCIYIEQKTANLKKAIQTNTQPM